MLVKYGGQNHTYRHKIENIRKAEYTISDSGTDLRTDPHRTLAIHRFMSRPVRIVVIPERKRGNNRSASGKCHKNVRSYRMGKVKSLYGGAARRVR